MYQQNKDKQIKEMAQYVCERSDDDICTLDRKQCDLKCTSGDIAKYLYDKGYRKTSDVAREIIDELSSYCDAKRREARDKSNYAMLNYNNEEIRIWLNRQRAYEDVESKIAELKKKYESEGEG